MKLDSAIWSAVAASFAALSAFLTMRIHRRNFIESVRPELVLEDWTRTEQRSDTITFRRIRNVGRGPAFRIMLNCHVEAGNRPQAVCSSRWHHQPLPQLQWHGRLLRDCYGQGQISCDYDLHGCIEDHHGQERGARSNRPAVESAWF